MGVLTQYVQGEADKKKRLVREWLQATLAHISNCVLATHVGKFTHPDVKVYLWDKGKTSSEPYVTTAGTNCPLDVVPSSAAYMATAKLLLLDVEGKTLLEHLQERSRSVNDELAQLGIDLTAVYEAIDTISHADKLDHTDGRIKQVYFPVADGTYHLLSVLPASSLLVDLRNRITAMNQRGKECRDKKSELYGQDWCDLADITAIAFGGTKPQNISTLNSNNGGKDYLLPAQPPSLRPRDLRLPKADFFSESLRFSAYADDFHRLHHLMKCDRNNVTIRDAIAVVVGDIVDTVVAASYSPQAEPAGWSDGDSFKRLPVTQKIWLDNQYEPVWKEREWLHDVSKRFGRWCINRYEKVMRGATIPLGDAELLFLFQDRLAEVLKEEVRYRT